MIPLVEMEKAELGYGRGAVLKNVSCRVAAGEAVGLVGPNGAGKTTFLRSVLGLIKPRGGRVSTDRSKRFAYVPQAEEYNAAWPLTVRETVELALRARRPFGRLDAAGAAAVDDALARTGVGPLAGRLFRDGSGGQRQRVLLAQALSQGPDALLLDEPTRGLDVVAERDFLALLSDLKARGLTLLLVTHSFHIPLNFCGRILLFKDGAVHGATPEELMTTKRLEEIYGVPFLRVERDGGRWVQPEGEVFR
jgi:ABC-type Mn2+/Zn2+ transport system ATPase subunit